MVVKTTDGWEERMGEGQRQGKPEQALSTFLTARG